MPKLTPDLIHKANKILAKYQNSIKPLAKDAVISSVYIGSFFSSSCIPKTLDEYMSVELTKAYNRIVAERKESMEQELAKLGEDKEEGVADALSLSTKGKDTSTAVVVRAESTNKNLLGDEPWEELN